MGLRSATIVAAIFCLSGAAPPAAQTDINGAWRAETYDLKDGTRHVVRGHIFFAERDWTVLFFVTSGGSEPKRGSAEGGTYTRSGDKLVFTHRYNLSAGEALPGLPASPLRMRIHEADKAPAEPCTIEVAAGRLTIRFPSGNSMSFRRS